MDFLHQVMRFYSDKQAHTVGVKICDHEETTECQPKKTNDVLLGNADYAAELQER